MTHVKTVITVLLEYWTLRTHVTMGIVLAAWALSYLHSERLDVIIYKKLWVPLIYHVA